MSEQEFTIGDYDAVFIVNAESGDISLNMPEGMDVNQYSKVLYGLKKLGYVINDFMTNELSCSRELIESIDDKARSAIKPLTTTEKIIH